MNTRRVNAAADVIARAMENGRQVPAAMAMALESAQMLMSPEQAAELEALRRKVADLESQLAALTAQGQVLRGSRSTPSPEGEFHSFLHHAHTTPHDLPPLGGAR
ncbi:hypothetical protein [Streptomyces sp. NPDC008240]|uniref:hypothetical protein n=1 Tax=Streptomyces sp. NPDC008240 TaxID=3364822 RepID=UPI0036E6BC74